MVFGTLLMYALFFVVFIAFMGVVVCVVMSIMASREIRRNSDEARKRILKLLPCTDCGKCGMNGCEEYALGAVQGTVEYRPCPGCPDGVNKRISLIWVKPKRRPEEGTEDEG